MHDIIKINIKIRLENKILKLMAQEAETLCNMMSSKSQSVCAGKLEAYQKVLDTIKDF